MSSSLLVFSPHPDDAEICIGGFLISFSKKYTIKIIQLTNGEASTNGDTNTRYKEMKKIQRQNPNILREYLNFPDMELNSHSNKQIKKITELIRKETPSIIMLPYYSEEHPDHKEAFKLIEKATYLASVNKTGINGEPHNCNSIFAYSSDLHNSKGSFYVDVSSVYTKKLKMLKTFHSQLFSKSEKETILNSFMVQKIISKDRYCGAMIHVKYAEELIALQPLCVTNILNIVI